MTEADVNLPDSADVLLVEDNPGDVRLMKEGFDASPFDLTVHTINNGDDALDFIFQRGDYVAAPQPDLVILDLNLPRTNGDVVLAELKRDPDRCRIPVIVFTSSQAEDDVLTSYDHHANACVTKPDHATEFIETIGRVVELWFALVRLPADEE
ncbi:response regulator [Halosolutus gelatinilyticus]|uniref:response regulator n=1 Tax=Halosolutus gelatinilyticus TaxID=2931975 RepID=UPI001FF6B8EA|nr:response regulator [Halosolutus gelatinilyticus]